MLGKFLKRNENHLVAIPREISEIRNGKFPIATPKKVMYDPTWWDLFRIKPIELVAVFVNGENLQPYEIWVTGKSLKRDYQRQKDGSYVENGRESEVV